MKIIKLVIQAEDLTIDELLQIGENTEQEIFYLGKRIMKALPDITIIKSDVMILDSTKEIIYRFLCKSTEVITRPDTTAKIYLDEKNNNS